MEKTTTSAAQTKQPQAPSTITGAEAVVRCLLAEGVDVLFGYPGGAIMPVYNAMYDYQNELKHILTRHEQGAVHAAQGYARASGKVGVCIATSGPGATNLITGIADACIDSTPVVCITGQVASHLLGSDAFQETDVVGISTPVTKWNIQITAAEDIPTAFAKAFYVARTGRPGPVLIDITKNAQFDTLEFSYTPCRKVRSYVAKPKVNNDSIKRAADLINRAERPYVLFGHGVLLGNAQHQFEAFIGKAGLPSAWTILGLSALPTNHKLNVGMLGMHGNYGPNLLTNECDVLVAVGMRFDDRVTGNLNTYAKQAKVVHLEIDWAEVSKNVYADVAVVADCAESLPLITAQLDERTHTSWLDRFAECAAIEFEKVIHDELYPPKDAILSMGEVIRLISEKTNGNAIMVTDVGQHQMVTQRYYNYTHWRSNITSGGLGTMGFCLPAAYGAKLARPDKQVIAVVGDGGLQMTIQELGTIFQTEIDVKILLLNNEFLGMVRQWQQMFFDKRYSATEMINPNFQMIARGYGIESEKVTERKHLDAAVDRFLRHKGSFLLEVMVGKENNVFPMVPSGACVSEIKLEP